VGYALQHVNVDDATGLEVVVWHGMKDGVPVIQIDGNGGLGERERRPDLGRRP
jgi:hypothetical protein